jgi:hypothetical protein
MGQVRGAAILGTLWYLREHFGEDAPRRAIETLPPEVRSAIGDGGPLLFEAGWYDYAALSLLTGAADRLYGKGDLTLAREIGRAQAFLDTGRFFKWMLRLTGPKRIFVRAASVWSNYHNAGRYVVEEVGDHHAHLRIEDWSSADPVMCRRIEGWVERAVELTLGEETAPRIHEAAHLARDPAVSPDAFCRFVVTWD